MESSQQTYDTVQPIAEERLTFDQYVQQLPASKQSAHRLLVWLVAIGFILVVGLFIYAIYTSVTWKSAGGINVAISWQYFFLAGGLCALHDRLDRGYDRRIKIVPRVMRLCPQFSWKRAPCPREGRALWLSVRPSGLIHLAWSPPGTPLARVGSG